MTLIKKRFNIYKYKRVVDESKEEGKMPVMIQYSNKVPSKIEYYEMIRSVYEDVEVAEIANELDNTIASICAYKGDRLIGMGRVKRDGSVLCIVDLIVKLDAYREEVQNNIIINLINQVNILKQYDITVRECLDMSITEITEDKIKTRNNYEKEQFEPGNMLYQA